MGFWVKLNAFLLDPAVVQGKGGGCDVRKLAWALWLLFRVGRLAMSDLPSCFFFMRQPLQSGHFPPLTWL